MTLLFIGLQLLNVIIATFKSVLTIRGTKLTAAIINAIAYSINIVIVYLVSRDMVLWASIVITMGTNLIGVYIGLTILDKFRKDQLWRIQTTIASDKLKDYQYDLLNDNIKFISYETTWDEFKVVDIFSSTREESKVVKNIIQRYDAKYTISANSSYL